MDSKSKSQSEKQPKISSITVPTYFIKETNSKPVAFFEIEIKASNGVEWKVKHRFSEFVSMHKVLLESVYSPPALPSKFSNILYLQGGNINADRQKALQTFL